MPEEGVPTPEKKSHTGLIIGIVLTVIVVLLALFFGLYFGLRNRGGDTPEEVNPDPEIVEPGPVEEPDGGDDGDGEPEPEDPVPYSMIVTGDNDLVVHYNNALDDSEPETLDLRETLDVTIYDQYGDEYTGEYGSEYTLSTTSPEISLDTETGAVTGVSEGTATVTVTSVANTSLTEDIEIKVTEKEYEVESISVSLNGTTNDDGNILLDWGETSTALDVVFEPTYATIQTYEVTPQSDNGLFTYNEATHTFTHTKLNTGTETFTITATDQSHSASATITLECDPVIDEPYEVVWRDDEEHSLPETIAKGESIENLDDYVEVHYHHENQDPNEYVDDTYTLSYVGSNGVSIEGTTATFTGDGGSTQYITVTATPDSGAGEPVYAQSSNIIITQAIEGIEINCSEYVFNIPQGDNFVGIAVYAEPDDAWPIPEVTWEITGDDAAEYVTLEPHASDSTQCTIKTTETTDKLEEGVYIDGITVTAYMDGIAVGTCEIAITTYDFATNSWNLIEKTAAAGEASTYYSVGDTRTIDIGDEQHEIRIDGFDHDDLSESDDNYNNDEYNSGSNKAAITCEMVDCLSETHAMRDSTGNSGGWDSSAMRKYLNTDSGCVLSTIETELQSIIRVVDKKATKGNASKETTTSSDSLFLLAYVELEGITANEPLNIEGEQYEYWSEHSTASDWIKTVSGSNTSWWLRSPDYSGYAYFYYVEPSGYPMKNKASTSTYGVSFAFCI